jgi:hypothetical protein
MADIDKFIYYDNGSKKVLKPTDRIVIGSGGLAFEGSTNDDFEVLLAVEDPTADRTITFPDEDGDIALLQGDSLPKSLSFPVKNPSSTTALTKGQIVYISGHSGNKPEVSLAQSDSASTMPAFGFIQSDIAAEAEGFVVYSGLFKGIDTNTNYSEGDTLYVSSTSAGDFQNSAPTGANLIQNVGKIIKSHTNNGELLVGGAGRTNATPNLDEGYFFLGDENNQSAISAYQMPLTAGTSGQFLTSNGTNLVLSTAPESGKMTVSTQNADFSASVNNMYIVDTSSGQVDVTLPYSGSFETGDRIKIFNHGANTLRIQETISGTNLDPNDGVLGVYGSYKAINGKCLVEVVAINSTTWSYVISPQLEFDPTSLTNDGEVFAYDTTTSSMKPLSYRLPLTDGSTDQLLSTNGSGQLTFQDPPPTFSPQTTITTTTPTFNTDTNYFVPGNSALGSITFTLPLVTSTGASSLSDKVFEISNFSGVDVTFSVTDRRPVSRFYNDVYYNRVIQPETSGAYTVTLPSNTVHRISIKYFVSGLNTFLNYYVLPLT